MAAIELMNSSQNHTMRMLDSEKPARELTFRKFSLLPYMSSEKSLSKRKTPFYPPPILHTLQHNSVNLDEAFPASQNRFHQRTYSVQETVRAEIAHNCVSPFESVLSDSNYSISSSGLESASIDDDDSDRAGICDDIGTFCQSGTNELGENTKVDRVEACNMNCSFDSGTGALVEHVDDLQFQRRKVDKSRALENRSSSVCETSQNTTKNKRKQALKNSIRAFSVSHPIGFSSRIKNLQKKKLEFAPFRNVSLSHEWEIVSLAEVSRRLSLDQTFIPLPQGASTSKILDESMIRQISETLPARAEGYPWSLIYSSEKHGFSLSTLYRKLIAWNETLSPILIVINDCNDNTFGGIASSTFRPSEHFLGTGDSSFLFKFVQNSPNKEKELKVFNWTGKNHYFVQASKDSLLMGASSGRYGLWLDADLNRGRSQRCDTFDNEPLAENSDDFTVQAVEVFGFSIV